MYRLTSTREAGFLVLSVPILALFIQLAALAAGAAMLLVGASVFGNDGIFLDQVMSETRAVRGCLRAIRDEEISGTTDCSDYAQAHLDHFAVYAQAPASAACASSFLLREYHKNNYRIDDFYEYLYARQIREDCSHSNVNPVWVVASLSSLGFYSAFLSKEIQEIRDGG